MVSASPKSSWFFILPVALVFLTACTQMMPNALLQSASSTTPKPGDENLPTTPLNSQAINLTNYTKTFEQDFSQLTSVSVGNSGISTGVPWYPHTPYGGDWANFTNSLGNLDPFGVVSGNLVIRMHNDGTTQKAGLLSSLDSAGHGFSQAHGYFEVSMKLPLTQSSWPAFWLNDASNIISSGSSAMDAEVDIIEQYGTSPISHMTLHNWDNSGDHDAVSSIYKVNNPDGEFHTYGVDIQTDYLTFYVDRIQVWQTPNNQPQYNHPLYVMVNLAYGGGNSTPSSIAAMPAQVDLLVKYVRVWQGAGGSSLANHKNYFVGGLHMTDGDVIDVNGVKLTFAHDGNLKVTDSSSSAVLWQTHATARTCASNCVALFQGDGNFVFSQSSSAYWDSATYSNYNGQITVSNTAPYLTIVNSEGAVVWSSNDHP